MGAGGLSLFDAGDAGAVSSPRYKNGEVEKDLKILDK